MRRARPNRGYLDATDEWRGTVAPSVRGAGPGTVRGGTVRGVVRGIQARSENYGQNGSVQVLTFRVERYDRHGQRLRPVPVEMRGYTLDGQLGEGEEVAVRGRWRRGTLRARELVNLTTGARVRARRLPGLVAVVVALVVLAVLGFLGYRFVADESLTLPFAPSTATVFVAAD